MLVSNSNDPPSSAYQVLGLYATMLSSLGSSFEELGKKSKPWVKLCCNRQECLDWGRQYIYICWQWLRSGSEAVDGTLLFADSNMTVVHSTSTYIKPPQWYYVGIVFYAHWSLNPTLAKTNRELMSAIKWCCKLLFMACLLSTRSCVSISIHISFSQ